MPVAHDRPLAFLGGLSATHFMREYWQKKPLLVRGAYRPDWISSSEVQEIGQADDIEARLVSKIGRRWKVRFGPQTELPRQKRNWTLLVQGVNLRHRAAAELLQSIDFLPAWRLDDVMLSYAVPGGGVGPHVDSYDVFLLQVTGRRRWRISRQKDRALLPNQPLKILANFKAGEDWVLEPGDMLYLPPDVAHDGVAESNCLTASIGFRAPSYQELQQEFLQYAAETTSAAGRYGDRGREPTRHPGEIDAHFIGEVSKRLLKLQFTNDQVIEFLGGYLSEPKANVFFDAPLRSRRQLIEGAAVILDARSIMLYHRKRFFLNGESVTASASERRLLRQLADARRLEPAQRVDASAAFNDQLQEWLEAGWIHVEPRTK
jgi:50S ribosomal protein L16 3-hydroxylase